MICGRHVVPFIIERSWLEWRCAGMQINVSQLLKAPIGTTREYEVDSTVNLADGGRECPVQGKIKLIRTQRGILVRAILDTEIDLNCSRCLSQFRCPLSLEFE
jgi:uncharacterized protein